MRRTLSAILMVLVTLEPAGMALAASKKPVADKPAEDKPAVTDTVQPATPVPYDDRLMRLAEIVGSVHYLRNLCKGGEDEWRRTMQSFIDTETANEPARKDRLVASFNRGWRGFASVYTTCTPAAIEAEARYRAEGATLVNEIMARYGN